MGEDVKRLIEWIRRGLPLEDAKRFLSSTGNVQIYNGTFFDREDKKEFAVCYNITKAISIANEKVGASIQTAQNRILKEGVSSNDAFREALAGVLTLQENTPALANYVLKNNFEVNMTHLEDVDLDTFLIATVFDGRSFFIDGWHRLTQGVIVGVEGWTVYTLTKEEDLACRIYFAELVPEGQTVGIEMTDNEILQELQEAALQGFLQMSTGRKVVMLNEDELRNLVRSRHSRLHIFGDAYAEDRWQEGATWQGPDVEQFKEDTGFDLPAPLREEKE